MDIKKTMQNLDKNGIKPYFVEKKEDVVPLVKTLINKGESVSCGGSVTLDETGVKALMQNGDYDFIDRSGLEGEQLRNAYIKTFGCDTFFTSSNAVTENGELYNVDGNSNRVAALLYGPKSVIVVCGINKIVKNIDEAIKRVKTIAAPQNTIRLGIETPCGKTGECVSLRKENPELCDGCHGDTRICCNYVVSAQQRHVDRIKVIIIGEEYGY